MTNNQIEKIKKFINSKDKNLLISNNSEEIILFYQLIIENYAKEKSIKIHSNLDNKIENFIDDIFGEIRIKIYKTTNLKEINKILDINEKKIIFTDYKNFKKFYNLVESINGYQYEKDIKYFIVDKLNLVDDDLFEFCIDNPSETVSELSKYMINKENYFYENKSNLKNNFILDIRKSIFSLKKNYLDIRSLYKNVKDEAKYKKFNFLTY